MNRQVFINLPYQNLKTSVEFFRKLGFQFDPQFTNDDAACLIISENIFVMLVSVPFFKNFTDKTVIDATKSTEVLTCFSVESKEAVDDLVRRAVAGGATVPKPPQVYDFMYGHGFDDLEGHRWEVFYNIPTRH